ncbi:MAG: HAMP domain-containing protein [Deltaproteobacteria bacterium]|nr:HAMP domain-containing protein [Deltaproteobacteria bacterium]
MSLTVRLLGALGLLAVFATVLVGVPARELARRQAEAEFERRIATAFQGARDELVRDADDVQRRLGALCAHDSFVDWTLVELERAGGTVARLPAERRISLGKLVPEQQLALRLDRLALVVGDGLVLASSEVGETGQRRAQWGELVRGPSATVHLAGQGAGTAIESHCARTSGAVALGVVGSRLVAPLLGRVGSAHGVSLSLGPSAPPGRGQPAPGPPETQVMRRRLSIPEIPGLEVTAAVSLAPLSAALRQIDRSILINGAIALLLSIALGVLVARGLSRPIVELAHQVRQVVRGEPRAVRGRGGRELEELARSFNRTIEELTAMRKRLAQTERIAARREGARRIAHEIKNPLAPIRAAVETLRRLRERADPAFEDYFEEATSTVLSEVQRIAEIVTEFTRFERMPAPAFERVDLVGLARAVVSLHAAPAGEAGPVVELRAEPLGEVLADPDQMVQVLTNLVKNGIEAASAVRPDPVVIVALDAPEEHRVRIRVSDNGPGVAPAMRARLFEPYATDKPDGTGLGLAIAQRIAQEHGGEISFLEGPAAEAGDAGACFELVLPVDGPPLREGPAGKAATGTAHDG